MYCPEWEREENKRNGDKMKCREKTKGWAKDSAIKTLVVLHEK